MKNQTLWMAISGITGLCLFLIANFTSLFVGSSVMAGLLQLGVNVFVFLVWRKAFIQRSGFGKFVAFWGIAVPVVMASITLWRIFLPVIIR